DFDDLYTKHLGNVYHMLDASPPHALSQPIAAALVKPRFSPQTAHIHPVIDGKDIGYFDWLGAATHVADQHSSAMHGQSHLLDTGYAGIDDHNLYCRLDFSEKPGAWASDDTRLVVIVEAVTARVPGVVVHRLEANISEGRVREWTFTKNGHGENAPPGPANQSILASLDSIFECQIPLTEVGA